jgi:hypothetical protein
MLSRSVTVIIIVNGDPKKRSLGGNRGMNYLMEDAFTTLRCKC